MFNLSKGRADIEPHCYTIIVDGEVLIFSIGLSW